MILGGLMTALFARGVTLVATSNIVPERLYENGLQRQRFLPVIALLEKYTKVVNVDAGIDYRLRTLQQAELYHYPLDAGADKSRRTASRAWRRKLANTGATEINRRFLTCRRVADDVAWFDFVQVMDLVRKMITSNWRVSSMRF